MVSSTLCPTVLISGSQNVYRAGQRVSLTITGPGFFSIFLRTWAYDDVVSLIFLLRHISTTPRFHLRNAGVLMIDGLMALTC